MFLDRSTIHSSLIGLIGFHNPTDPSYSALASSLLASSSGLYFNDVHGLITIENLYESIKNFSQYNYPTYSGATEYSLYDKVTYSGTNYEYINSTASTGNTPPNATYWSEITEFDDFLTKAIYNGIDRMLDAYMTEKKLTSKVKSIFDKILLFQGAGNYRDFEPNGTDFVGIRIRFKRNEHNLKLILNKVGHQFTQAIGGGETLTLSLYHDSQQAAIATWNLTHTTAKNFEWTALTTNNELDFDTYDAGGDWYIGYKQSELDGLTNSPQAINKDIFWDSAPCDCDKKWASYYKQYSKYIDVVGFSVAESEMPADAMFDPSEAVFTNQKNYGLNLNMTTKCDLSQFFIDEKDALVNALWYHVGLVLLESIATTTRTNNISKQIMLEAQKQLYYHEGHWGTVHDKARKAIKGLEIDFSGMNNACMPSDQKDVIKIRRRGL